MSVTLANYKIPKDPSALQRHVFTSNDKDDRELWHKAYGMRSLLETVANHHGETVGHNQLRKYTRDPRILLEWIDQATLADLAALRGAMNRVTWGVHVYNYLLSCWLVYRTKYQATLVCRIGKFAKELTVKQQVNALADHLQELKKFATANGFNLLWAFDHDELPTPQEELAETRKRVNTFHVHIYCSHKVLFRWCRDDANLAPFVPRHTVLTGTHPVRLPKLRGGGMIDWAYFSPSKDEGAFTQSVPNTLAYVAAKVTALHMRQTKPNIEGDSYTATHANRTARYVARVVSQSDPKGKPRKHWGYIGFGAKGTKFEMI